MTTGPIGAEPLRGEREAIVRSALWAAAADALGWITELTDVGGVRRRAGSAEVRQPVAWRRKIGGMSGVEVKLPAGAYSDDTQLRLATSRSIRGNGVFDAETFAKIELTVWPSYALGAGRGSKAAASSLARSDVNWFSNFFRSKDTAYMTGGGNGAAMRIQPHVWCSNGTSESLILNIARNAVVTHGAPHGFVGAIIHGLSLKYCLTQKKTPDIAAVRAFLSEIEGLPEILGEDRQLSAFWLPAWESEHNGSFSEAISHHLTEAHRDLDIIGEVLSSNSEEPYVESLSKIGCLTPQFRGSGTKTAIAACALANIYERDGVEKAIVKAVNVLESDTDTIATMAGALLGCFASSEPDWEIQDRDYIVAEAHRMAAIRQGQKADSFNYPDVTTWIAPQSQSDAVGILPAGILALAGIGSLTPLSQTYESREAVWQWMSLPFGQSILVKRRPKPRSLAPGLMPGERVVHAQPAAPMKESQSTLPFGEPAGASSSHAPGSNTQERRSPSPFRGPDHLLDEMTDRVIRANFDPLVLGECFNRIVRVSQSTQLAVAFAAIVAKAQISRLRRN